MIVPDVKPILNPYLAMASEKYLKEVTVGPVSALSGKVVLEEYDAAWKGIFEEEKDACETMPRPTANASIPAEQSAKINAPARASLSHRLRPMQPSALSARHCLSFPSG